MYNVCKFCLFTMFEVGMKQICRTAKMKMMQKICLTINNSEQIKTIFNFFKLLLKKSNF